MGSNTMGYVRNLGLKKNNIVLSGLIDCVKIVVELKDVISKTLYGWMVATSGYHFSNFLKFLDLCSFPSPYVSVSCILPMDLVVPLCAF
jgi:hypothetical protein